jgi:hypothetical protein
MVLILKKGASKGEVDEIRKQLVYLPVRGVNTKKFCGSIKLKEDALLIQKKMRNEWK